jgi:transposase
MKHRNLTVDDEFLLPLYMESEKDAEIKYRLAFLNSLKELDCDLEKACDIFLVAIPTAYVWIRKWNENGYDGIAHPFHESDRARGRPPKLTEEDLKKLKVMLGAKDNWLTQEVCDLIYDTWSIELSRSQVAKILKHKLNMHFSKPCPHDYRRPDDAEEQLESSLDLAYNRLRDKGFSDEDIAIGFLDESSPQTTANTVRFWHFGHGDIVKNTTKYKANAVGFYAIKGESSSEFLPNSKKESIVAFLKRIREVNCHYKAIIVMLDNFSSHLSQDVRNAAAQSDIELVFLPPYSPDLNSIEFIWKTVKRHVSENFIFSLDYLKSLISDVWEESSRKLSYAENWIEKFIPWLECRELCG